MGEFRKTIICFLFIFIVSLCLLTGCAAKHNPSMEATSSQSSKSGTSSTAVLSDAVQKSIANGGEVSLTGDSPNMPWMVPKNKDTVISEVTTWLQQAKPYMDKIPQSEYTGASAGYSGPAILYISTSDKHKITIAPAHYNISEMTDQGKMYTNRYISGVLYLKYDEQESYIQSSQLYNWLKNDKWETEFDFRH